MARYRPASFSGGLTAVVVSFSLRNAGLVPGNHWIGDRLTALKEGLTLVRQKQSYASEQSDPTVQAVLKEKM